MCPLYGFRKKIGGIKRKRFSISLITFQQKGSIMAKQIFLLFVIGLFLWGSPVLGVEPGDEAPDFTLETLDDGEITLSDHEGEIRVLIFFGCT